MRITSKRGRNPQSGGAFIELVVSLPMLGFLILAAIDVGRAFALHEALSSLGREVANVTFRDCVAEDFFSGSDQDGAVADNHGSAIDIDCVEQYVDKFLDIGSQSVNDFSLVLSVFACTNYACPASCNPQIEASCEECSCEDSVYEIDGQRRPEDFNGSTLFWSDDEPGLPSLPEPGQLIKLIGNEKAVVVAELSAAYPQTLRFFAQRRAYEATIF